MSEAPDQAGRPLQFGLRDMLLLVTAICVVLGAGVGGSLGIGFLAAIAFTVVGLLTYVGPRKPFISAVCGCMLPLVLFSLITLILFTFSLSLFGRQ